MEFDQQLKDLIYNFFFSFSRFEFALKETGYRNRDRYKTAVPDWKRFINDHENHYEIDESARRLIDHPPRKQILNDNMLIWQDITFNRMSDLKKMSLIVKTIRNNLFHGGKHGERSWDDPLKVTFLLQNSIVVINKFSELNTDLKSHYRNEY